MEYRAHCGLEQQLRKSMLANIRSLFSRSHLEDAFADRFAGDLAKPMGFELWHALFEVQDLADGGLQVFPPFPAFSN